ncbi:ABC transporter permease [Paenibacillus sp. N1-5-1-14]|uniref:ABC transporter permease n=1 Tax=Paenibacillus radicibacter TaxID=2972488 RepID=UPI002159A1BA|nr:ABC transporter permease [Paenibacillus radicibacter]MCR8645937.1 ABC transporter permease [Paenibacillus radicibacter]
MLKLMKLELKRQNLKPFLLATIMITVGILMFGFFFALVAKVKPEEASANAMVLTYEYVLNMMHLVSLASFSIFSSVVFCKFIIEDYKDDSLYLMFLYPVKRAKIFISKLLICAILTVICSFISQLLAYGIFIGTELFFPIMTSDSLKSINTLDIILQLVSVSLQSLIVGILATKLGFIKRSIPTTIITSVLVSVILCNLFTISNMSFVWLVIVLLFIISIIVVVNLNQNIKTMQLEGE